MKHALAKALAASSLAVATIAGTAMPASAAASGVQAAGCPSSGYPTPGNPGVSCTSLSNGAVFHGKYHPDASRTRTYTKYTKTGGSTISAKLGYIYKGNYKWSPYYSIASGTSKTYSWNTLDYDFWCATTVGVMSVSGGTSYQTPISRCQ
ncbi:hypothetical protein [Streptomyces sp. NPDC090026]|uniref:hypothetical protein n=1 Tax=Streptomyces sp. NPDC090026 TaxID=3365923 RepID=UPI00382EA843